MTSRLETLQIGMEWFDEHPGGLNRVYAHLLAELRASGVGVHGLVAGTSAVAELSHGLATAFAPVRSPVLTRLRALRAASAPWTRQHRSDGVIVSHFALNGFALLDRVAHRPFVIHFQGPWGEESRAEGAGRLSVFAKERLEGTVYRRATRAIVLSDAFRDILHQRFGVPLDRIHVIPGGVEVARFASTRTRADCRIQLGWPTDRPVVLCVRRLVRRVGLGSLVDAVAGLRERVPDALVLIAGKGPLRDELQARIEQKGLTGSVRLLGFFPDADLPTAYRAADLTVVPSVALEGFGLVAAESLAAGTPALVTPVGGLGDVVRGLAPELITASSDSSELGAAIADALLGQRAMPSAEACEAYARRCFDWPVVAGRIRTVYEQARA